MATMAYAVSDIRSTSPRDTLAGVAARSVPATRSHPLPLPTPPNSLSPALPAHGLKAQLQKARLEPVDSDLDLSQDGAPGVGSPPYDSTGNITPAMLAKHHLPEILLGQGPLAIRHITGYLTTSVPGFAGIPPAKARRLVVGALEGRGGEGGGLGGDVEFEKVGWGRWDARYRGQPSRSSPAGSTSSEGGIPINNKTSYPSGWGPDRPRLAGTGSSAGDSAAFSHDDDRDLLMEETEADKMSMDGSASASCSEAPDDDDVVMNDDPEDVTDDEDWATVGAAALRAASYSATAAGAADHPLSSNNVHTSMAGMRSISYGAGMARTPQLNFAAGAFGGASEAQEREAVEALLRLGSV